MLEGLVTWVLNNYLGRYVEDLNTDQLSIAVLSGEVELENLPLRKDALRHLGLPVEVKAGFLGRVRLRVPVRQLRSAPWVVHVERLYAVAGPVALDQWDQAAEDAAAQERKMAALDAVEACWRLKMDTRPGTATYYSTSYSSWLSYGTGLIADIAENLQLQVSDVHIRYEDEYSVPGRCVALGLRIAALSAQSCDANWTPGFTTHSDHELSYKTVDLTDLSVYWDQMEEGRPPYSRLTIAELTEAMAASAAHTNYNDIVAPVSAFAHLKRNRSDAPLRSSSTPRLVCDLQLEEVPITLCDWQYEQMIRCVGGLSDVARVQEYRRHRPRDPVAAGPRAWWSYAVHCLLHDRPGRSNCDWTQCLRLARENVRYVEVYSKTLTAPSGTLAAEDKKLKDSVEWSRDFQQLRSLREAAMHRVPAPAPPPPSTKSAQPEGRGTRLLAHWFPQWWGWHSAEGDDSSPVSGPELEREILEALEDSVENSTLLKRDAVFGKLSFALRSGSLALCQGNDRKTMLELKFENLRLSLETRPRSGRHSAELSLGTLRLMDCLTPDTLFPVLVGPPDESTKGTALPTNRLRNTRSGVRTTTDLEPLFHLVYERGQHNHLYHRLTVRSQSLDVVYQPQASRWLADFVFGPHQRLAAAARATLGRRVRSMLDDRPEMKEAMERRQLQSAPLSRWYLRLDICAPQIIVTESFKDPNAAIALVDFGRFRLTNEGEGDLDSMCVTMATDEDEEDMFMTPCSTPPGSEEEETETLPVQQQPQQPQLLNEGTLHLRLYERYDMQLDDLQVLVGRARDNWRQHAHNAPRPTSPLHLLDRFNITLRVERRLVRTGDPMYPALTMLATLPRLVVHLNETKVAAVRTLVAVVSRQASQEDEEEEEEEVNVDESMSVMSQSVIAQLSVEQLSLEVQSRGRSVAELQVTGVSASVTRDGGSADGATATSTTSMSLTVHGLLLVDALQTFGPDFELLAASHRRVAIDSMSGSLRDTSGPASPASPASPTEYRWGNGASVPVGPPAALNRALASLRTATEEADALEVEEEEAVDEEVALINVQVVLMSDAGPDQRQKPLRFVSVQFNNLDVTANHETIVELLGFARRSWPASPQEALADRHRNEERTSKKRAKRMSDVAPGTSTVLTFDFQRLSVLVLRAVGGAGRKIGTATATGARIHVSSEEEEEQGAHLNITGSLGGLHVLNLTPEGRLHQRIVSVGKEPAVTEFQHGGVSVQEDDQEKAALSFSVSCPLGGGRTACIEVKVRMASLWYTHSARFLAEVRWCAADFRDYLSGVARSLRTKAADIVALGLTPVPAPAVTAAAPWNVKVDVVLDTPVLVVPRSPASTQVLVLHLGRISVSNAGGGASPEPEDSYSLEVRDMNMYSLETAGRRDPGPLVPRADRIYDCVSAAPMLHDTVVRVTIDRQTRNTTGALQDPEDLELDEEHVEDGVAGEHHLEVTGCVVGELKVSLTSDQYRQLVDTLRHLLADETCDLPPPPAVLKEDEQDVGGVSTLSMDSRLRARLFPHVSGSSGTNAQRTGASSFSLHAGLEVAACTVELQTPPRQAPVRLSFRQFEFRCDRGPRGRRGKRPDTRVHVSLQSLVVEDLKHEEGTARRRMLISTAGDEDEASGEGTGEGVVSRSCPSERYYGESAWWMGGSLPDHLETARVLGVPTTPARLMPPPRMPPRRIREDAEERTTMAEARRDNLVLISCLFVEPETAGSVRQTTTTVDFNTLDVTVEADSWLVVLNFFSITGGSPLQAPPPAEGTELSVTVRSLSLTAVRPQRGVIARGTVSHVELTHCRTGPESVLSGCLGSLTVCDLTQQGGAVWRKRFLTLGREALRFRHVSYHHGDRQQRREHDAHLAIDASSVLYVHTKRFVAELNAFFRDFGGWNASPAKEGDRDVTSAGCTRTSLRVNAAGLTLLLPVSSQSSDLLVAELCGLAVTNEFAEVANDDGHHHACPMNVAHVQLRDVDVYAARRDKDDGHDPTQLRIGEDAVRRTGASLLTEKCQLSLRVDVNMHSATCHTVPDVSVSGRLSRLDCTLNVDQYRLIKDFLAHNLGEDTEHIMPSVRRSSFPRQPDQQHEWTLMSTRLDLQDVVVRLQGTTSALACVHFVRSRLTVESYSNLSQDVDLVAREVLVTDTRPEAGGNLVVLYPAAPQQQATSTSPTSVRVEIHSRKRGPRSNFTVLLNNIRLLAVVDWWREVHKFIFDDGHDTTDNTIPLPAPPPPQHELKVNITDSEIVAVEDPADLTDTSALILRSTTVVTWRPAASDRPLSVNLNRCELFSCVLSREADTALSILDPVTVNVDLDAVGATVQVQLLETTTVRLSYRDLRMLAHMAAALRLQWDRPRETSVAEDAQRSRKAEAIRLSGMLGFTERDCETALLESDDRLESAALWLTMNRSPRPETPRAAAPVAPPHPQAWCVKADLVTVCVIDDCGDADVPLAELSMSQVTLEVSQVASSRHLDLSCTLACDYYNRTLSGWEPFVEAWPCRLRLGHEEEACGPSVTRPTRLTVDLSSERVLNLNLTNTLLELSTQVRDAWSRDMDGGGGGTAASFRRKAPFVPFALLNRTGSPLRFRTVISSGLQDDESETRSDQTNDDGENGWMVALPGQTVPFGFGERSANKLRHGDTHKLRTHRLAVRVDGWRTVEPVAVDRVGLYLRLATPDPGFPGWQPGSIGAGPHVQLLMEVRLEGSARKLVTVRSAVALENRLPTPVELRLERSPVNAVSVVAKAYEVAAGQTFAVPLVYVYSHMYVRPLPGAGDTTKPKQPYQHYDFCRADVDSTCLGSEVRRCVARRGGPPFTFCTAVRWLSAGGNNRVRPRPGPQGHTVRLLPALLLVNLLPQELHYALKPGGAAGHVAPGHSLPICHVPTLSEDASSSSLSSSMELEMNLDGFRCVSSLVLPNSRLEDTTNASGAAGALSYSEWRGVVRLADAAGRALHLIATMVVGATGGRRGGGARLRVTVTAEHWLVNRTGLALVFRQEGAGAEAAGQFSEHEVARSVAPLPFTLADPDAGQTVEARLGKSAVARGGGGGNRGNHTPRWCRPFNLRRGVQVRRLCAGNGGSGRHEDTVFVVGVEVRQGKGRHRDTLVVTVTPRYHVHNRSRHHLELAQACLVPEPQDDGEQLGPLVLERGGASAPGHGAIRAPPGCHAPFHWARYDQGGGGAGSGGATSAAVVAGRLLRVRLLDVEGCCWSGGLSIDTPHSIHVPIRTIGTSNWSTKPSFLRLEVVERGASLLVVFADADGLPPPVLLNNRSPVSLTFHQEGCASRQQGLLVARPHTAVPYAWDEPTLSPHLSVAAPGGAYVSYDLTRLGPGPELTYENFIYVAFTGTFRNEEDLLEEDEIGRWKRRRQGAATILPASHDVRWQRLVLDVAHGGRAVTLAPKQPGRRSQLWRLNAHSRLVHEGSGPPGGTGDGLCLDIEGTAPQPSAASRLVLRPPDQRRRLTQTWKFNPDGRLCCSHRNMCVQAQDGFFGLRQGNCAVLGPSTCLSAERPLEADEPDAASFVPLEQSVGRQRLHPGSGYLATAIAEDGPTRVLYVHDIKMGAQQRQERPSIKQTPSAKSTGVSVRLQLEGGLGVSVVSSRGASARAEELLYVLLRRVRVSVDAGNNAATFDATIGDLQCDNQLPDAGAPVAVYSLAPPSLPAPPVLEVRGETRSRPASVHGLALHVAPLCVRLEELLLLELAAWVAGDDAEDAAETVQEENKDEHDEEQDVRRLLAEVEGSEGRLYFGQVHIAPSQVRLSVLTAPGRLMAPRLRAARRRLGLGPLVKFEDAALELMAFDRRATFEPATCLLQAVRQHFRDELVWQAAAILGSVDFLGNPLGFVNDVSEGVSGLIFERSVGALVQHVTHGLSNSAAKVTESLGDGLGRVALDDEHDEMRRRILRRARLPGTAGACTTGADHIVAGLKGLGFGLLGGATGIFKQVYEGASQDGVAGVLSGLGRGLVGAVAKPVVGVLDLATETARAVRDTSGGGEGGRRRGRRAPQRSRLPRVTAGPRGLLPAYDERQALGRSHLHTLLLLKSDSGQGADNAAAVYATEQFLSYEVLRGGGRDDLRLLLSDEWVRIVTLSDESASGGELAVVTEVRVADLAACRVVSNVEDGDAGGSSRSSKRKRHYVEMSVGAVVGPVKRPLIRCDESEVAARVARQINYARRLHRDRQFTLHAEDE